jgi:hypothetical protein
LKSPKAKSAGTQEKDGKYLDVARLAVKLLVIKELREENNNEESKGPRN